MTVKLVIGFVVSSRRKSYVDSTKSQGAKEMYYLGASADYQTTCAWGLPGARNGTAS